MNQKFKLGDDWIAIVYFKNEAQFKHRPVVVVGRDITVDIDVIIEYWKEAGLKHLSIARTTKI
ncbi:hypothetical protein D8M05_13845 [Oceanobacillus bengalensis]|uniref:Uncharacterized protein n=2 Tax=Oceanobacillus bengalensis TaxID=1435466 RepID=A0A494YVF4_9BACI|nr:hypothetical protein [Oceanobacillus bengalensis]RKQ14115.1 hypothetical protein D8M05_13845 [Oceanobacillus bengalensis]